MSRAKICPECLETIDGDEPAVYKICKDCKEYAEDLEGSVVEDSLGRAVNEEFELRELDGEDPHY